MLAPVVAVWALRISKTRDIALYASNVQVCPIETVDPIFFFNPRTLTLLRKRRHWIQIYLFAIQHFLWRCFFVDDFI